MAGYYNAKTPDEKRKSNNTYGPNFYNYDTHEKLSILYWDSSIAFIISKFTENSSGGLVEDTNNSTRITIKSATSSALVSVAEEALNAIKHGDISSYESTGIPCGSMGNNMVEISNGTNINREPGIYLVLYKDISDDRKTKNRAVYTFSSKIAVKGYNSETGEGRSIAMKSQEFKDFVRAISDFSSGMNLAYAHAVKEATKYEKMATTKVLSLICANMGIDLMSNYSGGNKRRSNTPFNGNSDNVIDIDSAQYKESEYDIDVDISDIE